MQAWDAITSKRNVRRCARRPIEQADLEWILDAARRTPSSRNRQRWGFVVYTNRERLRQLTRVWRGAGHVAESAATIALVAPHSDDLHIRESIWHDLGQATMSIALAAADPGIGRGHASVANRDLAGETLRLPSGRFWARLIALGRPADRPRGRLRRIDRRPFDDVVHGETW